MNAPLSPRRVVVVNLDETWNFAGLVRRGALDVFADPDRALEIRFRTLGGVDHSASATGRAAVWGAERPLVYGDDLESLADDLIEDVDDLVEGRIADLAMVVVLADPDTAGGADAPGPPDFLVRLEEEIHLRIAILPHSPQRWICVRDRTGGTDHPRLDALIDALTFDPAMMRRQVADHVFRLRASRVGAADLEVDKRHFLALRVVVAIAVDMFPRRIDERSAPDPVAGGSERTSPIGELIKTHTAFDLALPGAPAPTTSAAVAELFDGHRRAAEAATPGIRPRLAGEDLTDRQVRTVVEKIETEMAIPGHDTTSASADREDLMRRTLALKTRSNWWSPVGERDLVRLGADVAVHLDAYVQRRIVEFAAYRTGMENRITTEFDAAIRTAIRSIPMVGGGLSGASAVQLDGILARVAASREAAEAKAERARARFMGALLPGAARSVDGAPRDGDRWLDLGRIDLHHVVTEAQAGLRGVYRGLVPRAYFVALVALFAAAAATVLAHAWGKAGGVFAQFGTAFRTQSTMLAVAVASAFAIGFGILAVLADLRRRTFHNAVEDLQRAHTELWQRVTGLTDAAFTYVAVSRHLLYFHLLETEIARRRRDEDTSALVIAFEDIARHGETAPLVPRARAAAHAQEMTQELSTLPPVRWFRRMLEVPSTFAAASAGPQRLRFVLSSADGGASGAFTAAATVFLREQTVELAALPIAAPRPPPATPKGPAATEDAA